MPSPAYKSLIPALTDAGGGALYIPLSKLVDTLESRATVLAIEAARPGLDSIKTELVRGQRLECLLLLDAFKDQRLRPVESPILPDLN